jgi:hypothetical protein
MERKVGKTGLMTGLLLIGVLTSVVNFQSIPLGVCSSAVSNISFNQMDFNFSGTAYNNTDWGSVDLTFIGQGPIMYFNLAINGSWQVQNIPVLSIEGVGVIQTISFTFGLGVPSGSDVTSVSYGYSFTSTTVGSMPVETATAPVFDQESVASSGIQGEAIPPLQPAKPLVGGAAASPAKFSAAGFPNQDCEDGECAPAAVSNSLQYLNKKHNLNMKDSDISIAKMKSATGWHAGPPPAAPKTWGALKAAYMIGNGYKISTRIVASMSELAGMDLDEQDVEICGYWHAAAVVGITDLGGGKYKIDVAHDTEQGVKGGTKTESITYDENDDEFSGSPGWFDGSGFLYAVVECPEKLYYSRIPRVQPIHMYTPIGDTLTAPLRIMTIHNVSSWKAGFRFDPSILECVNFTEGSFLSEVGTTTWTPGTVDNVNGVVTSHNCTLEAEKYRNGTGALAYIAFRVKSYGITAINLTDEDGDPCECTVLDHDRNEISLMLVNGSILVTIPGDVNGDFKVDIKDLVLMIKYFGSYPSHPTKPWNPNADINGDGKVDIKDLVLVVKHFQEHYP